MPLRPPAGFVSANYDPLKNSNPPTSPAASAGSQTASVSFTAPTNTGGGAITNYYAVSNPGQVVGSSVTSPISVSGLTNNTEYTFKVWAENAYGPSAYSAPTNAVTPAPFYVEDVFSTYVYTGNGSSLTINNAIDLSGKGGLVWIKCRTIAYNHVLFDTLRGGNYRINSNTTDAQGNGATSYGYISSFNSNGFSVAAGSSGAQHVNYNNAGFVSWTFCKAEKFFDVVTYTGNGVAGRTIAHNLGSVPGCIIVKCTNTDGTNWRVYHRSLGATYYLGLESTAAAAQATTIWNDTEPTSTVFSVGTSANTNQSGWTYVAYLFAHDAGGFGANSTDNVISCGSFTTDGSGAATVTLGYEPQWALFKCTTTSQDWFTSDSMRGMPVGSADAYLVPNTTAAESTYEYISPTATGFTISNQNTSATYIYIAIRRGPMKTPTDATKVYYSYTGSDTVRTNVGFNADVVIGADRNGNSLNHLVAPRLTIGTATSTASTAAESANVSNTTFTGNSNTVYPGMFGTSNNVIHSFGRAPGFMDVVCYTGTGLNRTIAHNLGVAPELFILKKRSGADGWPVYVASLGAVKRLLLNNDAAQANETSYFNSTAPTSSVFTVGTDSAVNASGSTYVAYLFATVAGVSKVGTYTGNGSTQTINCGFVGGARFVIIKRVDQAFDWYTWDTARGMVAGTDPFLLLSATNAENNTNTVYTAATGFQIVTSNGGINASGGTYIFLAIA